MSRYTTELRYLIQSLLKYSENKNYKNVNDAIKDGAKLLFNFNYPIFNEEYRDILQEKIVKHYWTREIGFETSGAFRFALETKMQLIMPRMNKLYESALLEYNPLHDIDYTSVTDKENELAKNVVSDSESSSTSNGESSTTGHDLSKFSDAPKNSVTDIETDKYLTNATNINTESSAKQSATGKNETKNTDNTQEKGTGKDTTRVTGRQGKSASQLIAEYRDIIINPDEQVIAELEDLFMLLW